MPKRSIDFSKLISGESVLSKKLDKMSNDISGFIERAEKLQSVTDKEIEVKTDTKQLTEADKLLQKLDKQSRAKYLVDEQNALRNLTLSYEAYTKAVSKAAKKDAQADVMRWGNAYKAAGYDTKKVKQDIFDVGKAYYDSFNKVSENGTSSNQMWLYSEDSFKKLFEAKLAEGSVNYEENAKHWYKKFGNPAAELKRQAKETAKEVANNPVELSIDDLIKIDETGIQDRIDFLKGKLEEIKGIFDTSSLNSTNAKQFVKYFTELNKYFDDLGQTMPEKYNDIFDNIKTYFMKENADVQKNWELIPTKERGQYFNFNDYIDDKGKNKKGAVSLGIKNYNDTMKRARREAAKIDISKVGKQERPISESNDDTGEKIAKAHRAAAATEEYSEKAKEAAESIQREAEAVQQLNTEKEKSSQQNNAQDNIAQQAKENEEALRQQAEAQREVNEAKEQSNDKSKLSGDSQEISQLEQMEAALDFQKKKLFDLQKQAEAVKQVYDDLQDRNEYINARRNVKGTKDNPNPFGLDGNLDKLYEQTIDHINRKEPNMAKAAAYYGFYRNAGGKDRAIVNGEDFTSQLTERWNAIQKLNKAIREGSINVNDYGVNSLNAANEAVREQQKIVDNVAEKVRQAKKEAAEQRKEERELAAQESAESKAAWSQGLSEQEIAGVEAYLKKVKALKKEAYNETDALAKAMSLVEKIKKRDVSGLMDQFTKDTQENNALLGKITNMPVRSQKQRNAAIRSINQEQYDQLIKGQTEAVVEQGMQGIADASKDAATSGTTAMENIGQAAAKAGSQVNEVYEAVEKIMHLSWNGGESFMDLDLNSLMADKDNIKRVIDTIKLNYDTKTWDENFKHLNDFIYDRQRQLTRWFSRTDKDSGWDPKNNAFDAEVYKNFSGEKTSDLKKMQTRLGANAKTLFSELYSGGKIPDELKGYKDELFGQLKNGSIDAMSAVDQLLQKVKELHTEQENIHPSTNANTITESVQTETQAEANAEEEVGTVIDRNNQSLKERLAYLKQIKSESKFMETADERKSDMEDKAWDAGGDNPRATEAQSQKLIQRYEDHVARMESADQMLNDFDASYEQVILTMKNGEEVILRSASDLDEVSLAASKIQDVKFVPFGNETASSSANPLTFASDIKSLEGYSNANEDFLSQLIASVITGQKEYDAAMEELRSHIAQRQEEIKAEQEKNLRVNTEIGKFASGSKPILDAMGIAENGPYPTEYSDYIAKIQSESIKGEEAVTQFADTFGFVYDQINDTWARPTSRKDDFLNSTIEGYREYLDTVAGGAEINSVQIAWDKMLDQNTFNGVLDAVNKINEAFRQGKLDSEGYVEGLGRLDGMDWAKYYARYLTKDDRFGHGARYLDEAPEGWKKLEGALTAPQGYEWYSNGASRFSNEYQAALVKVREETQTTKDTIVRSQEEIQAEIERTNNVIKIQEQWMKYLGDPNAPVTSTGKRDATDTLRNATKRLANYRMNPEEFIGQMDEEKITVHWWKAMQEAQRQGVANSTISRYRTDISESDYEGALAKLQESLALHKDILQKSEDELVQLQAELQQAASEGAAKNPSLSSPAADQHREQQQSAEDAATSEEHLKEAEEAAAQAGASSGEATVQHQQQAESAEEAATAEEKLKNATQDTANVGTETGAAANSHKQQEESANAAADAEEKLKDATAKSQSAGSQESGATHAHREQQKAAEEAAVAEDKLNRAIEDGARVIRETDNGSYRTKTYELSKGLTRTESYRLEQQNDGSFQWAKQTSQDVANYNVLLQDTIKYTQLLTTAQAALKLAQEKNSGKEVTDAIKQQINYYQQMIDKNRELAESYAKDSKIKVAEGTGGIPYTKSQYDADVDRTTKEIQLKIGKQSAEQIERQQARNEAELKKNQAEIDKANHYVTQQLQTLRNIENKYDSSINAQASHGITGKQNLDQFKQQVKDIENFLNAMNGVKLDPSKMDTVTSMLGDLKRFGDNAYLGETAKKGDLSRQSVVSMKKVLSANIDTFQSRASLSNGDVSDVLRQAQELKDSLSTMFSGDEVSQGFTRLKELKAQLQKINEETKLVSNTSKEVSNAYQENINKIKALGEAHTQVNNIAAEQLTDKNSQLSMEQGLENVKTAAEEAKNALYEVYKMYKSGDISKEDFDKALQLYKSDETRNGSQNSRQKELLGIQKVVEELSQSYIKLADAKEKAEHSKTVSGREVGKIEQQRLKDRQEELKRRLERYNISEDYESIATGKRLGELRTSEYEEKRNAVVNTKGLGFGEGDNVEKTWDVLIQKASQYQQILFKRDSGGTLTVNERATLEKLAPLYDEASQHASDAKNKYEELQKAISGANDNIVGQTIEKYDKIIGGLRAPGEGMPQAYNDQVKQLRAELENIKNIDIEAESDKWYQSLDRLKQGIDKLKSDKFAMPVDEQAKTTLNRRMSDWINKNTAGGEYLDQMKELQAQLSSITSQGDLERIAQGFENVRASAASAGKTGLSFGDGLIKRFKSLGQYLLSFASFYRIIGTLKQAVNIVKELDTGLMEVRKVAKETDSTLKRWQKTTFNQADMVGGTASQIEKSTAAWLRLGKSFEESMEAAQASVKLLNVSEFTNIDDATTSLVSMRQAFEDLSYEDFIDKLNGVGDNFSSSTDQLAQGMQNVSAVLKTAGNDIDQSLALLTAANNITQDMSKASMGVRTVALRIAGTKEAKEELEEYGEDTSDFVVQTASKVDAQVRAYTRTSKTPNGVSVLDDNGRLRDTFDILLDIAKVYDDIVKKDNEFGTNTSNALLELLAGKTRSNILASILQAPDILEQAYETSKNSQGVGQRELDVYLDSIEARMQKMQNRLQELAFTALSSDFIKTFIDGLTEAIKLANQLVKTFGLLPTVLGGIFGFGLRKSGKDIFTAAGSVLGSLFSRSKGDTSQNTSNGYSYVNGNYTQIVPLTEGMKEYQQQTEEAIEQTNSMAGGLDELGENAIRTGSSFSKLAGSLINIGKAALTSLAITAAITVATKLIQLFLDKVVFAHKKMIEAGEAARDSIKDTINGFNDSKKSIEDLGKSLAKNDNNIKNVGDSIDEIAKKYDELHDGVNEFTNANESLTADDYNEYLSICNQLAEQYPTLVKGYDAQDNAIVSLGNSAEEAANKLQTLYQGAQLAAHVEIGSKLQADYDGATASISDYEKEIKELEEKNKSMRPEVNQSEGYISIQRSKADLSKVQNIVSQLGLDADSIKPEIDGEYGEYVNYYFDGLQNLSEDRITAINNILSDEFGQLNSQTIAENLQKINANKLLISDQWASLSESIGSYLQTSDTFAGLNDDLQSSLLGGLSNINIDKLADDYNGDVLQFLYTEIIEPLTNVSDDAQSLISSAFEINPDKMSIKDYQGQVESIFGDVFGEDADQWLRLFGFRDKFTTLFQERNDVLKSFSEDNALTPEEIGEVTFWPVEMIEKGAQLVKNKYYETLDQLKKDIEKESVIEPTKVLSDIFSDDAYVENVEKYKSNLSTVTTALQNLKSEGFINPEDKMGLQELFPDLTDFSYEGISKAGTKELNKWINELTDNWKDFTPEGLEQLDTYVKNLTLSYSDLSVSAGDAMDAVTGSIMQSGMYAGASAPDRAFEEASTKIQALKDEYGEDLNWNVVLALQDYFTGDVQTLIDKYGDYTLEWNIKISNKEAEAQIENLTSERGVLDAQRQYEEAAGKAISKSYYEQDSQISRDLIEQYEKEIENADKEFEKSSKDALATSTHNRVVNTLRQQIYSEMAHIEENDKNAETWEAGIYEDDLSKLKNDAEKAKQIIDDASNYGKEVTADQYQTMIDNAEKQIKDNQWLSDFYNDLAQQKLAEGDYTGFLENTSKANEFSAAIVDLNGNIVEWKNNINSIDNTHLSNVFTQLQNEAEDLEHSLTDKTDGEKAVIYVDLQINAEAQKKNLEAQRQAIIDDFNKKQEENGVEYSFNDPEYQTYLENLRGIDDQLRSLADSQREWANALLNTPIDAINKKIDEYDAKLQEIQDKIKVREAKGGRKTAEDYDSEIELYNQEGITNTVKQGLLNAKAGILEFAGFSDLADEAKKEAQQAGSDAASSFAEGYTSQREKAKLPLTEYDDELTALQQRANAVQRDITAAQEASADVDASQFDLLISNADQQIAVQESIISYASEQLKGLDPTENIEDYLEFTAAIESAQDAIAQLESGQRDNQKSRIESIYGTPKLERELSNVQDNAHDLQNEITKAEAEYGVASDEQYNQLADLYEQEAGKQSALSRIYDVIANWYDLKGDSTTAQEYRDKANNAADNATQKEADALEERLLPYRNEYNELQHESEQIQRDITKAEQEHQKVSKKTYQDLISNGKAQIRNMKQQQKAIGAVNEDWWTLQNSIDSMNDSIYDWSTTMDSLVYDQAQQLAQTISTAMSESFSETGLTDDTINALKTAFSDLDSSRFDVSDAFYSTADGVKVNTEALQELTEAEFELIGAPLADEIANVQAQLDKDPGNSALQDKLDSLMETNAKYFAQYEEMQKALSRNAAIDLAESTSNAGANYDENYGRVKTYKEAYEKGLTGTDDFKAWTSYLDVYGRDTVEAYEAVSGKIERYFTEDAADGLGNFLTDMEKLGYAAQDADGYWTITADDYDAAAKDMQMGSDWFMDTMNKLEDFGFIHTYVSSLNEAQLKTRDVEEQIADAVQTYSDMVARGASDEDLQKQIEHINELESQWQDLDTVTKTWGETTEENRKKEFLGLDDQLAGFEEMYKNADTDAGREAARKAAEDYVKQFGYTLEEGKFKLSADDLVDYESRIPENKFFGDAFTNIGEQMSQLGAGGNVDLLARPLVDAAKLVEAGWEDAGEGIATVYSSTYSNADENVAMNFTPIITDENGHFKGVLSPDELQSYAEGVIDGVHGDYLNLQMGATFTGDDAIDQAVNAAEQIHELQEQYYLDLSQFESQFTGTEQEEGFKNFEQYYNNNTKAANEYLSILSKVPVDTLKQIQLSNDSYEIDKTAEDAFQGLADVLGYTNENAGELLDFISLIGVDLSKITVPEEMQQLQDFLATATNSSGAGYQISTDISRMSADQLKTQMSEIEQLEADINVEIDPDSDIYKQLEELKKQTEIQLNIKNSDQTQTQLKEWAETGNREQIAKTFGIDVNSEEVDQYIEQINNMPSDYDLVVHVDDEQFTQLISAIQEPWSMLITADTSEAEEAATDTKKKVEKTPIIQTIKQKVENFANAAAGFLGLPQKTEATAGIDTSGVEKGAKQAEKATKDVSKAKGTATADINIAPAMGKIAELRTALLSLSAIRPMPIVDQSSIGNAISRVQTLINKLNEAASKKQGLALGTAHSLGTAPLSRAHANGTQDWTVGRDENALVNEIGQESRVRNGVWELIPGGPHVESLRKDDIIFNAEQTADLIRTGKTARRGQLVAHANGTVPGMSAYGNTSGRNRGPSPKSNTKSSTKKNNRGNGGNGGNGGNTGNGKNKKKKSDFETWLEKLFDWIEVRLDRIQRRIDLATAKAENAIGYGNKNSNIVDAMNEIAKSAADANSAVIYRNKNGAVTGYSGGTDGTKIGDSIRGALRYQQQADKVAQKARSKGIFKGADMDTIIDKIQTGRIDINEYTDKQKKFIEAYKEWYDKSQDLVQATEDLKKQYKELAQTKLDNITEEFETLTGYAEAVKASSEATVDYYNSAGFARNTDTDRAEIKKQQDRQNEITNTLINEIGAYKGELKNAEQIFGINSNEYREASTKLKEMNKSLIESQKTERELAHALYDLAKTVRGYFIDRVKSFVDKLSSIASLSEKRGTTQRYGINIAQTEDPYLEQTKYNNELILKYYEDIKEAQQEIAKEGAQISSERYEELYKTITDGESAITSLLSANEDLKESIRTLRWKGYNEFQEQLNTINSDLEHLQGFIRDGDIMDNDAQFTDLGFAQIALIGEQMDTAEKKIRNAQVAIDKLDDEYKNHTISLEKYNEELDAQIDIIQDASGAMFDYQQKLADMYIDQITAENDALQDLISARKEALSAKKE